MAQRDMGIGVIGQPDITIKRKFRYTFEIVGFCNNAKNNVPEHFVKTASRPNLSIEETTLNFLNARTWIPGKAEWQDITITYVDAASEHMALLWNWLVSVYDFTNPTSLKMGNKRDWAATGILTLYDGCGSPLETWELKNLWPKTINFGDLDYGTSDEATIELGMRYSDVRYTSYCPSFQPQGCCTSCSTKK
jgi:hypothetical protein